VSDKTITATVFRFDPATDQAPYYNDYAVPIVPGDSAMDILDYIYQNLDGTLAYYDHAGCSLGICGRCTGRINGKPGLFCQTFVEDDVTLEPLKRDGIVKDLICERRNTKNSSGSK